MKLISFPTMRGAIQILCCLLAASAVASASAAPLGTAFTYQGRLTDNGTPATGLYDLQFLFFDALTAGNQQGVTLQRSGVGVTNGLFTATLDFGPDIFTGMALWLELRVSPANAGNYSTLAPRQALTPAPYAIWAANASVATSAGSVAWNTITGVPGGLADGVDNDTTYAAGAGLALAGNVFSLNSAFTDARYWKLTGNAGTTPGVNFLGTTDNQALELKVNNSRALRLEPNANSPNVIGGYSGNAVNAGVQGAVISGGGTLFYPNLGGPWPNVVTDHHGNIGGGLGNRVEGAISTIGGGFSNLIQSAANYAVIAGGGANIIGFQTDADTIGGGGANLIQTETDGSTIAGGVGNLVETNSDFVSIGGGYFNTISANVTNAVIAGGVSNVVGRLASHATIGGGRNNSIGTNSTSATVAGGSFNRIQADAPTATISGGGSNSINTNADYAVIAGGRLHLIRSSAAGATIGGGSGNDIGINATYTTIAGGIGNTIQSRSVSATIGGGNNNDIGTNSNYATIAGGSLNAIQPNATAATIGGGGNNTIQTNTSYGTVSGGFNNVIATNADYATIPGGRNAKAVNYGQHAHASGRFAADGDAQTSTRVLRRPTTTTNLTELFLDGSSLRMKVPTDGAWTFDLLIIAASNTDYAGYQIRGVVANFAGLVGLLGAPVKTTLYESDATWDANVEADVANAALVIKVRGAAGQTIRWVASVRTVEVIN